MKTVSSLLFSFLFFSLSLTAQGVPKERVIILTDIEADPDDTQSLVRLFLYANQIEIKGIVATTSCWLQSKINPESIRKVIRAYGKVQPNLLRHESGYPDAQALLGLVKEGIPKYGMLGVGNDMDTEGSDWIIKELEKEDDRPLWISVWGGVNTLAQALHTIKKTKSNKEAKRLTSKLRVYTISDQDDSGIWIRNTFPDLFYIVSPGDHYGSATWTGINSFVKGIDNQTISNSWLAEHIQQNHGPLGAQYPDVAWGMEGDTPAFLALISNGLNDPEHPEWGGWGGRYELYKPDFSKTKKGGSIVTIAPETRAIWTNAIDNYTPYLPKEYGRTVRRDSTTFTGYKETLWRWRDDFQYDFAARMDWCLQSYEEANHPPVAVLSHPEQFTVTSGAGFSLDAFDSTDPDGDNLGFLWYHYPEAGSYQGKINMGAENVHIVHVTAPEVEKEETAHFILKLSDKGSPSLSRYKRVIVTILPKQANPKPRILISTDIGGTDPDDFQSMIHLLMYADLFQIEGLISSPYGDGRKQDLLDMIDLYEKDLSQLKEHSSGFPDPDSLRGICKQGTIPGAPFKGYDRATEGSDWIIQSAKKPSDQALWVLVWGGLEDLAQALHDAPEITDKIKVYWIGGPNKKWSVNAYAYIAEHHPDLWMIEANATYRGWFLDSESPETLSNQAFYDNHIQERGNMGKAFKSYYKGIIKMGDTPSLTYVMNGNPDNPLTESWGGNFTPITHSSRTIFDRNTTTADTIVAYAVLEWRFKGPELTIPEDSACFTMEISNQVWPGYYVGDGNYSVRYSSKKPEICTYLTSSAIPELDRHTGQFVSITPWPAKPAPDDYQLGSNWYGDRQEPEFFFGVQQGARTVSKYREAFLLDWAKRWKWIE